MVYEGDGGRLMKMMGEGFRGCVVSQDPTGWEAELAAMRQALQPHKWS